MMADLTFLEDDSKLVLHELDQFKQHWTVLICPWLWWCQRIAERCLEQVSSTGVSLKNANSLLSEEVSRLGCRRVSLEQVWIFVVTLLSPCFATSFKAFIPLFWWA